MAKTKAAEPIAAQRLKSFIERIEKLEEERRAISSDIKDVYSEAKGVGYDVKTIRKIVQLRRQDAADRAEAETLLDAYMHAIGMDTSASVVMPTEEELIDRAARIITEVDRCLALVRAGKLPKIADIQDLVGCSLGKASKLRAMVAERISRSNQSTVKNENENPPHDPETGEIVEGVEEPAGKEEDARTSAQSFMDRAGGGVTVEINASPGSLLDRVGAALEEVAPGRVHRNVQVGGADDDLDPPPFLDRRAKATA